MAVTVDALPESEWVGEGEMPPSLDRVNWAAAFFSFLWMLYYGTWEWILGLAALLLVPLVAENVYLLTVDPRTLPGFSDLVSWIAAPFWMAAIVVVGLKANRIAWVKGRRFRERQVREAPLSIGKYLRWTRVWTYVGAILLALRVVVATWAVVVDSGTRVAGIRDLVTAVIPFAVLAMFEISRSRRGRERS